MAWKGHVRNGVVVLDESVALPENASMEVSLVSPAEAAPSGEAAEESAAIEWTYPGMGALLKPLPDPPPGSQSSFAERYPEMIGAITGLPPDFAENHDHDIHGQSKKKSTR